MADGLAVYEAIAVALAERREPDLSPLEPTLVRTSLERVLGFPSPRQAFLTWLDGRVQHLSRGAVALQGTASDAAAAQELHLRLLVQDEPFTETAVLRVHQPVLRFPLRSQGLSCLAVLTLSG